MPVAEGEIFAGYTIVRLLGSGGMGEVYLAQHPRLPRREALKILPAAVSADSEYRLRFAREADIAASLWHPHIVSIHDRGEQDGQLWIAMDYVEGTDAARLLRSRYPRGMPLQEVIDIVSAIADALDYAHDQSLLHRDVKPSNILITDGRAGDRRILLADFGIARGVHDIDDLTATNMTVGSVDYAAPEQLTGGLLDGRADQYALACTAFHLLTGVPPFIHSNPAVVIGSHLSSDPPPLTTLRPDLGAIEQALAKAMRKEPPQRFSSCREFSAALAGAGTGAVCSTAPTQLATPVAPLPPILIDAQQHLVVPPTLHKGRRTALIAGAIALLAAVGVVAFAGARFGQPSVSSSPTTSGTPTVGGGIAAQTVTLTAPPVTVTHQVSQATEPQWQPPRTRAEPVGDLGLATPMTYPSCNGEAVVILGSVTTLGEYREGIQRLLDAHPGAGYLRTDMACPSLRQATEEGNPIYAVYTPAGSTLSQACAAVHAVGGDAYAKWLDSTTDPGYIIHC